MNLYNMIRGLLLVSAGVFVFLSILTIAGVVLILMNGGQV